MREGQKEGEGEEGRAFTRGRIVATRRRRLAAATLGYSRSWAFANSCENTSSQLLFAPLSKLLSELLTPLMKEREATARCRLALNRSKLPRRAGSGVFTPHTPFLDRPRSDTHAHTWRSSPRYFSRLSTSTRFHSYALASPLRDSESFCNVYGKFNSRATARSAEPLWCL